MAVTLVTNLRNIVIEGPLQYKDMTTNNYQILVSLGAQDIITICSLLYNIEEKILRDCKDQATVGVICAMAQFVYDEKLEELPVPEYFIFEDEAYKIAKKGSLGKLSFGQMVVLKKEVENKTLNEGISFACAVYLQPYIDQSSFNLERAREIEQVILQMPITYTFPVGFFCLRKLRRSGNLFINVLNLLRRLGPVRMIRLLNLRGWKALNHLQI